MKTELFENYIIQIGKSAIENTNLINASIETDIWFHIHNEPSCHVILKNVERMHSIPNKVIKRCAYLCKINTKANSRAKADSRAKANSRAKKQNKCEIIYAYIANVRTTAVPGQVEIDEYKLVSI